MHLDAIQDRIKLNLRGLPVGSSPESVWAFTLREHLDASRLSAKIPPRTSPPANAKYVIHATDSYIAKGLGMNSWVVVQFWFDKDSHYLSATVELGGIGM